MNHAETLLIGGSEQKSGMRHERCDGCGRQVWLPRGGQDALDDAEEENRDALVSCVACAMKRLGQPMVIAILVGQSERWR